MRVKYSILQPELSPYHLRVKSPSYNMEPRINKDSVPDDLLYYYLNVAKRSEEARVIFLLQLVYGLRYADVMAIKNRHVCSLGLILIEGTKSSNARIIYFPELLERISTAYRDKDKSVFNLSYSQYYSILKRSGVYRRLSNQRKNLTVSHLARKFTFEYLRQQFHLPEVVLRSFSGHKSDHGLSYYIGYNSLQSLTERGKVKLK